MDDLWEYYDVPSDAVPATYTPISAEERKRRVAELNERVKEGVKRIQTGTEFREFLIGMSHFHNYSWGNQMLIWLQKPDAKRVAGYNTWRDLGRYVKSGEKGIAILAPLGPTALISWTRVTDNAVRAIRRSSKGWAIWDDAAEKMIEDGFPSYAAAARRLKEQGFVEQRTTLTVNNFKVVHVFDVSQTEGKPLPQLDMPELTTQTNPELWEGLLALCQSDGVSVSFNPNERAGPTTEGFLRHPNFIWIRPTNSPAKQLNVLLHEYSHYNTEAVFHIPSRDAETIAECSAFVIGAFYGFDTGVISFPYVAVWSREEKVLYSNLKSIQEVAEKIIDRLESRKTQLFPMTQLRPTKSDMAAYKDRYKR